MKFAMFRGLRVPPLEFVRLAGNQWKEQGLYPCCEICDTRVHPNFLNSLSNVLPRFDHFNDAPSCPLSSKADERYAVLKPSEINPAQAAAYRAAFMSNFFNDRSIQFFEHHVGRSGFKRAHYEAMVDKADQLRIWSYQNIALWSIPFVLLSLIDFEMQSKTGDPFEVQFQIHKPTSLHINEMSQRPTQCSLKKIYRDTGKACNYPEGNPFPITELYFLSFDS